jgi:hypothetical protein
MPYHVLAIESLESTSPCFKGDLPYEIYLKPSSAPQRKSQFETRVLFCCIILRSEHFFRVAECRKNKYKLILLEQYSWMLELLLLNLQNRISPALRER